MKGIGELLDKFKNLTNHSLAVRTIVREVLKNELDIDIPEEHISLKDKTVYLKISGAGRSEIVTEEKRLIGKINSTAGKEEVDKIR